MSIETTVAPAPAPAASAQQGPWTGQVGALLRRPSVWLSAGWLLLVVVVSLAANAVARQDPLAQDLAATFQLPSARHWLGTDSLGRDLFSRLVHGGGYLLLVAAIPVAVSYVIGVPAGLLAGYVGGRVDTSVGFVVNVMFSVPGIVVTLAVAAATGNSLVAITLVLGVVGSGAVVRLVGASTRATKNLLYVDAARVARLSRWRILLRHILPNVAGPLIVQGFLVYGGMFLFLTGLAFLSLGFSPETPSWGQMTYEASQNLAVQPWLMVPVGGAIILTVLSLNTLGSALLDVLPTVSAGPPAGVIAPVPTRTAYPVPSGRDEEVPDESQPPPEGVLLAVRNLSIAIAGVREGKPIVQDVTLDVRRGTTLALVGESGSGKTLTALAVLGLLPPVAEIVGGRLRYGGTDLAGLTEAQLRRFRGDRIAFVSQEPMVALDPCYPVRSQLTEALREHTPLRRRAARARAAELLRLVGIPQVDRVLRGYPHQLSGGMAQRVAIALALSGEPDLLVADEPTTALDVTVQAEILDLLRGLRERLAMTTMIVTHELGIVADLCDDVAVMYAGQIVETGPVSEVLRQPLHPYTQALLAASDGAGSGDRARALVRGGVPAPADWPESCRFASRCSLVHAACTAAPVSLRQTPQGTARCVLVGSRSEPAPVSGARDG